MIPEAAIHCELFTAERINFSAGLTATELKKWIDVNYNDIELLGFLLVLLIISMSLKVHTCMSSRFKILENKIPIYSVLSWKRVPLYLTFKEIIFTAHSRNRNAEYICPANKAMKCSHPQLNFHNKFCMSKPNTTTL